MKQHPRISIQIVEVQCTRPSYDPAEWTEDEIREHEVWWMEKGQFMSYHRASLLDDRFGEPAILNIRSSLFVRDSDIARECSMTHLEEAIGQAIEFRLSSHPDPV
jgi:hypothetical protein